MGTKVLNIDTLSIDIGLIKEAAGVIHNRGLVAFPTETVYGLGADALEARAVARIFEAKKRPLDDPLIVHIWDKKDLYALASEIPLEAERFMERFWPGPLTMILKRSEKVPELVTTGLDTVAVRMPSHPVARKLLEISGTPIAAPSANLFGRPSPTDASHVIEDLDGRIDMVLDSGNSQIGVESTVIEFIDGKIIILRPGGITAEEIMDFSGKKNVVVYTALDQLKKSPGKYIRHYSPKAPVALVESSPDQVEKVISLYEDLRSGSRSPGIIAVQEHFEKYKGLRVKVLGSRYDSRTCASRLFHILREFDREGVDHIIAEGIDQKGLGLAVMNRLKKAAGIH